MKLLNKMAWAASFMTFLTCAEEMKPLSKDGIVVDESNFRFIFNESLARESASIEAKTGGIDVEIGATYNSVRNLNLTNNYYSVDYGSEPSSVPMLRIAVKKDLRKTTYTALSATFEFGYGYKSARVIAQSARGIRLADQVALQWIPISAGVELQQKIPGLPYLSAFLAPSIGSQYFNQTGNLDGLSQGYWVNAWTIRLGLNLFEPEHRAAGASFNGVTLGVGLSKSLASTQLLDSRSLSFGVKFAF